LCSLLTFTITCGIKNQNVSQRPTNIRVRRYDGGVKYR